MKYGILVICLMSSMISYGTAMIINREGGEKKKWNNRIAEMVIYFLAAVFVVSFFQCITGDAKESFLNCFGGATYRTYMRYGIILVPCAVLLPVVFYKLFRQRTDLVISHAISCFIMLFAVGYAFFAKSNNRILCAQLIAGAAAGIIAALCGREACSEYMPIRKKLAMAAPGVLWAGITYILYIPNQSVLANLSQVPILYTTILGTSVVLFLLFIAVYGAVCIMLPDLYAWCYSLLFFGLTLCGYIQYNLFNRKLASLDGDKVSYAAGIIWGNYAVWAGIMLVVCVAALLLKRKFFAWYKYISYLFCLTQLIAFAAALLTADYGVQRAEILTVQHINEFAGNENVVLFVLDRYDEQYMDLILKEDPDFLSPLSDFTHYRNAVSEYGHTYMVLPYMLSGVEWPDRMPEEEYYDYANQNAFFLDRVNELGYESDVYSDSLFVQQNIGKNIRNWDNHLKLDHSFAAFNDLWTKISRYGILPYGIAEDFYYSTYDMEMVVKGSGKYIWGDDTVIYRSITDEGISVNRNTDKLFKVIHMYGAHAPYYMNENFEFLPDESSTLTEQARASMKIVYKYIEEMQKNGIYDRSTIIITADHGQSAMHEPDHIRESGFDYVSVPILFVKEAGESHNEIQNSKAPVTLHEMIPTLLRAMGDDAWNDYGRCYDEIPEDEQRTRYFYWGGGIRHTVYNV